MLYINSVFVLELVTEMVDTLTAILWQEDVSNVNLIEVIPPRLVRCKTMADITNGRIMAVGYLPSPFGSGKFDLRVSVNGRYMRIDRRSICKWFYGNNFQTLTYEDLMEVFHLIGDMLGVPIGQAVITRLDIGHNLVLKHPIGIYLNYLGKMSRRKRVQASSTGIYYEASQQQVCLYDKYRQQLNSKELIPPEWQCKNVLRLELRYLKDIARQFKRTKLTVGMLCAPEFYHECVQRWVGVYHSIQKLSDFILDFTDMRTKSGRYIQGITALAECCGGTLKLLEQVATAQAMGLLTRKEAYSFREEIKAANNSSLGRLKNGLIAELDHKIEEAEVQLFTPSQKYNFQPF
jgi:hypothetical protein